MHFCNKNLYILTKIKYKKKTFNKDVKQSKRAIIIKHFALAILIKIELNNIKKIVLHMCLEIKIGH